MGWNNSGRAVGRWFLHLWEAILCLWMFPHLVSEQWVMIERKSPDLRRDGAGKKKDDDNDNDEEENLVFSNC